MSPAAPARLTRRALKDAYYPNRRLGYYVHALPEHGVVYVKNPKAACSTLLVWLNRLHTGDLTYGPRDIHSNNLIPPPREVGWDRVLAMLGGAAYRFTFVREPLARLESAYRNKIVDTPDSPWQRRVRAALGQTGDSVPSFEEFLTVVEGQDPVTEMDPHWRPQHLTLMHPMVTYDRIGRLENIEADLALVRAEAGLPDLPLPHRNRGSGTGASVYDGRPDLVSRATALYAHDFELYGY